jgi:nucleoside-diphosphate-sugar epimerase
MAKVFVTGANGFIGSHLIEALLERGDEVIGLVRTTSDLRNLRPSFEQFGTRFSLAVGDLCDPTSLNIDFRDIEYVYHLGAVLLGKTETEFSSANVDGTRNILEMVNKGRIERFRRFLFTSSLAAAGPSADGGPIDERRERKPVSWYGKSKRDAEDIVAEYAGQGLPVTIVRPAAVYGERERDISTGTFPIVQLGLRPKAGFKKKRLSMIYVGDLVRAIIAAAESDSTTGKTYFLSDPRAYSHQEFISTIAAGMNKRFLLPLLPVPFFAFYLMAILSEWLHHFSRGRPRLTRDKVRELRQQFWVASPAAAEEDFGWSSQISLREGLDRAVRSWRDQDAATRSTYEPLRERAIKTYSIIVLLGVINELLGTVATSWYRFTPWWITLVVIVVIYGGIMGSVTLASARFNPMLQFLFGAVIGFAAETINHLTGDMFWHFDRLQPIDGWVVSAILYGGIPAGVLIALVNWMVGILYSYRLRVG